MNEKSREMGSDPELSNFVAALERRITPQEIERFLNSDVRRARLYNRAFDKNSNEASYIDITLHIAHQIVRQLMEDIETLRRTTKPH